MKAKTKLIMSIMSICLVCAVFAIGVFALKNANLKIGGDVSFSATGVEADIKNVTLTGATTDDQVLATGKINTSMTQAEIDSTFQNWQTLKLDFDADATDIELKFDIANTSTNADNYIEINYDYSFTTVNPNVDVFPGDENTQKVWENNNYILEPKGATPEAEDYETFTLKFRVVDKELNVPQGTKVSVIISLKHVTPKSAAATNNVVTIDNIQYTLNPSKQTASVSGHTLSGTNVSAVIHPIVKDSAESAVPCVVKTIASSAFMEANIVEAIIPSSVITIESLAFSLCDDLLTINIPSSVTSIGETGFAGCVKLTALTIPRSIKNIASGAFMHCTGLTEITIPGSMTSIGSAMFQSCAWLSTVVIQPNVVSLGSELFMYCESLTTINIPESVTTIGSNAFQGCTSLTTITIPKGVTYIDNSTFADCSDLISVNLPEGISSIGSDAFNACSSLTSIIIPNSVTFIDAGAFRGCSKLVSINIPEGVTSLSVCLFQGCEDLKYITIPTGVTTIGGDAFKDCISLSEITIPANTTSIGECAFSGCSALNVAKFENSNGWFKASSADATEGTTVSVTSSFTEENATVLKGISLGQYLLRKDA